jgi:DNA-binding response OmpR family regulator
MPNTICIDRKLELHKFRPLEKLAETDSIRWSANYIFDSVLGSSNTFQQNIVTLQPGKLRKLHQENCPEWIQISAVNILAERKKSAISLQ